MLSAQQLVSDPRGVSSRTLRIVENPNGQGQVVQAPRGPDQAHLMTSSLHAQIIHHRIRRPWKAEVEEEQADLILTVNIGALRRRAP